MHTNNLIIRHKAGLLNLAEELQNVSEACKIMGVSRDTLYRYQELVETDGLEGLINRERRAPNTPYKHIRLACKCKSLTPLCNSTITSK